MILLKKPNELTAFKNESRWLVQDFWLSNGVGILAAEPKSGKTWLAWDIAVSVSSGTKVLESYQALKGKVLVFNGEDSEQIQRERLHALCKGKNLNPSDLDLDILITEAIKLDSDSDVASLRHAVAESKPTLLILDCFVRLHSVNENNSKQVAQLLAKLRAIQKEFGTAIILVHHAAKGKSKNARGGNKMRGSGELHAWGDSNLYLSKNRIGDVLLDIEHRAAPSINDIPIVLTVDQELAKLTIGHENLNIENSNLLYEQKNESAILIQQSISIPSHPIHSAIELEVLAELNAFESVPVVVLSANLEMHPSQLALILHELEKKGSVVKNKNGWLKNNS